MSLNGPGSRPSLCDILTASLVPKIQPLRISHSQLGVCEPECLSWEGCLGGLLGSSWLPHVQIPAINSTSQVLALNTQISVSTVEWQWLLFNFQLKKKKIKNCPRHAILVSSSSRSYHRADIHALHYSLPLPPQWDHHSSFSTFFLL